MDLSTYRKKVGLSQEDLAIALGLSAKSKGWICEIETGARPPSLRLALKIEKWSGGKVSAAQICPLAASLGAGATKKAA